MTPITPPATLGILGGGQLGRYTVIAAASMGYRTIVLDPDPSAPAGLMAREHLVAAYDDPAAVQRLAFDCDAVTIEFENPPASTLENLAATIVVAPSPSAVGIAQDRVAEKTFLVDNGFPVGPYALLDGDLSAAAEVVADAGAIVKTARLGYDGHGQRTVRSGAEALAAWADLGGVSCVIEQRLELDRELSVIVARTSDGDCESWPVAENRHVGGVLDLSVVPASIDARLADRAVGLTMAIADALGYVGVLAVEFFVVDGALLVNELAPRPHNSGHWTLDASITSQFEQQVRAVCGLGLGSTEMTAPAVAMVNLLGDLWQHGDPNWAAVLDDPLAKLHLYGKAEARPGRKMGHLTVTSELANVAADRALELRDAAVHGPATSFG